MKKFWLCLLGAALCICALFSCGENSNSDEPTYYTVTFQQDGRAPVVKEVEEGADLTDIPAPEAKTGYDVQWERTVFEDVSRNMTVWAVETPKRYTVTFDANGGAVATATKEVTYDAIPASFPVPTYAGYDFVCWQYDEVVVSDGVAWRIANDVTLTAKWAAVTPQQCTVTFLQAGQAPQQITVDKGESVQPSEYPAILPQAGYTAIWENVNLSNVTENITVNAVVTANTYTVTFNADGGTVSPETKVVTFGAAYELPTPTRTGYDFQGWKDGEAFVATSGTSWGIANRVTLVAAWREKPKDQITVTLDLGYGAIDGQTRVVKVLPANATVDDLPTPTLQSQYKSGGLDDYDFVGWKVEGGAVLSTGTPLTDGMKLTAVWSSNYTPNY